MSFGTSDVAHARRRPGALTSPNVLLVFPKFTPNSFWNIQAVCDLRGARCPAPPLGLITVAALLPPTWSLRLINRNAEELTEDELAWADVVMTGGMLAQREDTVPLIDYCHERGKPVVVGGPDAMSSPDIYEHADFRVLGEAEGLIEQFIAAWSAGATSGDFQGEKFQVDITKSPVPRFDLLKFDHYLFIGIQFSRGCPFTCEFCDIIELYGRVPRAKTNEQVFAELDALYRAGHRGHVDFVDDNLIGNRKALKRLLPALADWQKARWYPFEFSTEASINLADDSELLQMMRAANFFAVFIGIESSDQDTLVAMQKKQNTRRSIPESVHRIYEAGMFVIAGFIIGFDSERESVARDMIGCVLATSIPICVVGLLVALPNTQLGRRLAQEGRSLPMRPNSGDQCTAGLNFVTLRPRQDVLSDYRTVLAAIYSPSAFFGRVRHVGRVLQRPIHSIRPVPRLILQEVVALFRLIWRFTISRPSLAGEFWLTVFYCGWYNPRSLRYALFMSAFYLHLGEFAAFLNEDLSRQISAAGHDKDLQAERALARA